MFSHAPLQNRTFIGKNTKVEYQKGAKQSNVETKSKATIEKTTTIIIWNMNPQSELAYFTVEINQQSRNARCSKELQKRPGETQAVLHRC